MKVLITGSSSKIGMGVAERLLADGREVVALDRLPCPLTHERLTSIEGDVRDLDTLIEVSRDCQAGLHLAVLALDAEDVEMMSVNVVGAYTFFRAANENGFRMAILASSAPVHLPRSDFDFGFAEPPADADAYDLSKSLQEAIGADFHRGGVPVFCIRFGHVVFGSRQVCLDGLTPLHQLEYCRGGWVALEDVVEGCVAAVSTMPDAEFGIYSLVGARAGRCRFDVAATEERLGLSLKYDFAEFESGE